MGADQSWGATSSSVILHLLRVRNTMVCHCRYLFHVTKQENEILSIEEKKNNHLFRAFHHAPCLPFYSLVELIGCSDQTPLGTNFPKLKKMCFVKFWKIELNEAQNSPYKDKNNIVALEHSHTCERMLMFRIQPFKAGNKIWQLGRE